MSQTISNIVDIKRINPADQRFKISLLETDIKALAASIKTIGLIYCPVLRPMGDSFSIICGFNRINALIENNILQTPAIIFSEKTSELDCYKTAIASLAFKRPLTHAELILSIKHLTGLCDIQRIEAMALELFNLELNKKFIQDLQQIGQIQDPCLELIQKEHLTIKSARRLAQFNSQTTGIFLDLFSKIKASSSKQIEIITFMNEITARDSIPIYSLYENDGIQKILLNPDLPPQVKTDEIRLYLYQQRFPTIFDTRSKIQTLIQNLKLGSHMKLTPPENFEGTRYSFSFTAKDMAEFNTHLQKLNILNKDKTLKQIIEP